MGKLKRKSVRMKSISISELLNLSLIEYQRNTKRYRLHDLVRIFAENKLRSTDKETTLFGVGEERH